MDETRRALEFSQTSDVRHTLASARKLSLAKGALALPGPLPRMEENSLRLLSTLVLSTLVLPVFFLVVERESTAMNEHHRNVP